MKQRKTITLAAYGVIVIASGLLRFFGADGGSTGLWFGFVMGTIALIAAWGFNSSKPLLAVAFAWIAVAVVGGWFFYEALIKKGLAQAEPRQLFVIAASIAVAVVLLLPNKPANANTLTEKSENV